MDISTVMKKLLTVTTGAALIALGTAEIAKAALITFDDIIVGQTSFSFDGTGDGVDDVIFSTTDPAGFNTVGPGPNQNFINEPGLEGTSLLNPDLRVDFIVGAINFLRFGFALNSVAENANTFASFEVYNSNDELIASDSEFGLFSPSSFPEGQIEVSLPELAAYALFDFSSDFGRYIIDNFEGTFGTTEVTPVPEPASIIGLLAFGAFGAAFTKKRS